uniref:Interleukin n=1 Tax=Monopterus albus TaxID=43700 RepID=A0A3Q3K1X0_MONAL
MENFIKIAFWIAFVSGCLQAKPFMRNSDIPNLKTDVKCPSNSTFYAPTNVKEECIATALDCVVRELKGTVKLECEDPKDYIDSEVDHWNYILDELKRNPVSISPLSSSECACEKWPETPFNEFLEKMESLLQLVASTYR